MLHRFFRFLTLPLLLIAACSQLSTLQRLDALAKSAKQSCEAASPSQKLQRCHLALACAEPVSVAQHKVLAAEQKMQAMEASDNERAVAAVAVVAAEAACRKAGIVAERGVAVASVNVNVTASGSVVAAPQKPAGAAVAGSTATSSGSKPDAVAVPAATPAPISVPAPK